MWETLYSDEVMIEDTEMFYFDQMMNRGYRNILFSSNNRIEIAETFYFDQMMK